MKRFIFLALFISFFANTNAQTWKAFRDTAGHFTASYPDTWENKIKEGNRVFFTSPAESDDDKFRQNINISANPSPDLANYKIRELIPEVESSIKTAYDNYQKISSRYFTWNGTEAYEYVYSFTQASVDYAIRIKQWMCIKNGVLYMITYTAAVGTDNMAATAGKIMNSIKF